MTITSEVARRCLEIDYDTLPEALRDRVKYLLLDYLGVAIRGVLSDSSIPVHRFLGSRGIAHGGVPVCGTRLRVDTPYAALALGVASHSLELDDVVNAASLHPAVSVMSAALAVGAQINSSGRELMEAIVAGYEVTVKLGIALDPAAHYAQGFHPTGTCGTMGAAVAAARLLRLDRQRFVNALGIAGSQAAGSMEFLADGSYTKRFHAGWSAHAGVVAALLAAEGFTGPGSIIEGRFGFLHAYSPASDPDKVLAGWGDPYEVMNTSIKPHACCRYKQGSIDCILQLMQQHQLRPGDVEKVQVAILKAGYALVADPPEAKLKPKSVVDAQFSMPFGAAVAMLKGNAFLDQYCLENVESTDVQQLMEVVECVQDAAIEQDFPRKWPAKVAITTRAGETYHCRIDHPKGDPENPLSWEEIIAKFDSLAGAVLDGGRRNDTVARVRALEQCSSVRELMETLQR
ncbi:MAG: MmgE/PrpD family protein [Desulfofustis sp.]|nr:MmgE/PrpD family protein [Desulfofustis sp.]